MSELARVLCIDDEPNVLRGLERTLYDSVEVVGATSGEAGLQALETQGPFAVVISDMRMPGMNGAEVLARVRVKAPDTTRILLTGGTDLAAAADAVNRGQIFRFLSKPCPADDLCGAVAQAVEQYRLRRAERELLEGTLNGTVRLLGDMLSVAMPAVFQRSTTVRRVATHIASHLPNVNLWEVQVAATLAPIGCIALDDSLVVRAFERQPLSADERARFAQHPEVGYRLLHNVPRLTAVANAVRAQNDLSFATVEAAVVALAVEFDLLQGTGLAPSEVITKVRASTRFPPAVSDAIADYRDWTTAGTQLTVLVEHLKAGMYVEQDVVTRTGLVVLPASRELTVVVLERIRRFHAGVGIVEPIRVRQRH